MRIKLKGYRKRVGDALNGAACYVLLCLARRSPPSWYARVARVRGEL